MGKKRKRYILFRGTSTASSRASEEFVHLLLKRYPTLTKKAVVWVPNGLIVRSDGAAAKELRAEIPELRVEGIALKAFSTSGSISKLKRLAAGEDGWR